VLSREQFGLLEAVYCRLMADGRQAWHTVGNLTGISEHQKYITYIYISLIIISPSVEVMKENISNIEWVLRFVPRIERYAAYDR
jgi:hypothetical protein